jgi:hypothetical protein
VVVSVVTSLAGSSPNFPPSAAKASIIANTTKWNENGMNTKKCNLLITKITMNRIAIPVKMTLICMVSFYVLLSSYFILYVT